MVAPDVRQRPSAAVNTIVDHDATNNDDLPPFKRRLNTAATTTRTVNISAKWVPRLHTFFGYSAFLAALAVCHQTHWKQVLKNEVAGWPQEWFPSVSAVTGDWYPARNVFQILIALAAGPRFLLLLLNYLTTSISATTTTTSVLSSVTLVFGLIRTLSCGGWVYITSSDQHDVHDVAMITYLVAGLLYMGGMTVLSRRTEQTTGNKTGWRSRAACIAGFLAMVPGLVYFFIRHKLDKIPGAYSYYALFEWSVILFDVGFDHATSIDVNDMSIQLSIPAPSRAALKLKREADLDTPAAVRRPILIGAHQYSSLPSYVADTYLGFCFWSLATSLGLTIWYFPLWNMGLSGFEAFLFTSMSPMLLGLPFLRRWVHRFPGIFHLLSLVGLLAYRFPDPTTRLCMVGTGVGFSFLAWSSALFDADAISAKTTQPRSWKKPLALMLGLLLHNVVKIHSYSNNPLWPTMRKENGGWNELGLGLAVLACLQVLARPYSGKQKPAATNDVSAPPQPKPERKQGHWTGAAAGFAGLIFALHSMLSDSGIIPLWATEGYPNPGPPPLIGGVIVLAFMGLGLLASSSHRLATSSLWWLAGTAGVNALYFLPSVSVPGRALGFAGGLIFTMYISSIAPTLMMQLPFFPAGRTMFLAMFLYAIMQLAHVWTVAYAFVPLGEYARERTHYVVAAMQFLLFLGTRAAKPVLTAAEKREAPVLAHKLRKHEFANLATMLAVLYLGLAAAVGGRLSAKKEIAPMHPEERLVTMGIWTVHFGLDNEMYSSHKRMAEVIGELELDVIGLLESDTYRIIMGNRDLTQYLSSTLGMYADYGPSPTKHTWGCSLLSRFPITSSTHHLLPSPAGELACAIHATLDVHGTPVDVVVSHNGQEEDWVDRKLQTNYLAGLLAGSKNPSVFLGYVVTKPGLREELYRTLVEKGRVEDVDESDWDRWCQYIFFRGLHRTGYARISHGGITDTEIQTAKFVVPTTPLSLPPTSKIAHALTRTPERDVPKGRMYPEQFKGKGVRGHFYHVFGEPRYWTEGTSE
ncbi:putative integral plasma membrane protein [Fimicolochytrium jonesii]|uniref:putative integral plasma membrane protein n=1 Tax=Fimicolochytrium jonesii TaxID=1396493 RepID=UPI0022FEAD93|nr:putative integral plasma membrane protein [Fimicolochytrium jonesii]KAI8819697.1 putative integral plasma membrane protein [Fimicolochytrium jonesii]